MKRNGEAEGGPTTTYQYALGKVSHVIQMLNHCLVDLIEAKQILLKTRYEDFGLEVSAGVEGSADVFIAADTMEEMVGTLVSNLQTMPVLQKVLVASHSFDLRNYVEHDLFPQQPAVSNLRTQAETKNLCIFGTERRKARVMAVDIGLTCTHTCMHHQEVLNSSLWRKLPEELVAMVFANLPLHQIIGLWEKSNAWSALSKTTTFQRAVHEAHPKLFGIFKKPLYDVLSVAALDMKSNKWLGFHPDGYPDEYYNYFPNALYCYDGGLVCIVPSQRQTGEVLPVLVCNPMTNVWKKLPASGFGRRECILAQLVTDHATHQYKVLIVGQDKVGGIFQLAAEVYHSDVGEWSKLDSGFVCGSAGSTNCECCRNSPFVFDCRRGTMVQVVDNHLKFRSPSTTGSTHIIGYTNFVKDHLFVVHETRERGPVYKVSEFAWHNSSSDMREVNRQNQCALEPIPDGYYMLRFASDNHLLLIGDNNCEVHDRDHHQVVRLYDRSAEKWRNIPAVHGTDNRILRVHQLQRCFMMELRWDAIP